jgi:hypothetical protein
MTSTSPSPSGQIYKTQSVQALVSVYEECRASPPLTKKKATEALIEDQQQYGGSPAGVPA